MTTPLSMVRDINGFNTFGLQFSDTGFQTILSTSVEQNFTVPVSNSSVPFKSYLAIFALEPGARVYVARNATASVPSGSFTPTVSELNPTARQVYPGDVLSFITDSSVASVNVKLYAIQ